MIFALGIRGPLCSPQKSKPISMLGPVCIGEAKKSLLLCPLSADQIVFGQKMAAIDWTHRTKKNENSLSEFWTWENFFPALTRISWRQPCGSCSSFAFCLFSHSSRVMIRWHQLDWDWITERGLRAIEPESERKWRGDKPTTINFLSLWSWSESKRRDTGLA